MTINSRVYLCTLCSIPLIIYLSHTSINLHFLAFLSWPEPQIQCWLNVARLNILVLFLILGAKHSILIMVLREGFWRCPLASQWWSSPFIVFWVFTINEYWILSNPFFCIYWDYIFKSFIMLLWWIVWLIFKCYTTLHSWNKLHLVRRHCSLFFDSLLFRVLP